SHRASPSRHVRLAAPFTRRMRRLSSFILTLAICLTWLIPAALPGQHLANAQTPAAGIPLTGDFKGTGATQIATLSDPADNLALRIQLLERDPNSTTGKFITTEWFTSLPGSFDIGRMKWAATDA